MPHPLADLLLPSASFRHARRSGVARTCGPAAVLWVALAVTAALGCASDSATRTARDDGAVMVQPRDFVVTQQGSPRSPTTTVDSTTQSQGAAPMPEQAPSGPGATATPVVVETAADDERATALAGGAERDAAARVDRPLSVDGMVGQINGRPVFADDILDELEPALVALGQRESLRRFRATAREQIDDMVRNQLINALILSEAERALTEREWNGLRYMVDQHREELLRRHGQGSAAVAERNLGEVTGRTLDETLERYRDRVVTETYVRRNFGARVNVSRRDVERYYQQHPERFNPEPVRDLRLIVAADADAAAQVESALQAGEPFAEVAAGPLNTLAGGGVMAGIAGNAPFGRPEVDAAVAALGVGETSDGIDAGDGRVWFVRVDSLEQREKLSFEDAQGAIERSLQDQQFNMFTEQFKSRLLAEGNFTRPDQMVDALVEIAVNRYARR